MISRVAGNSLLIIAAENSISARAEASRGSIKPAEIPTATQLRCQKVSRWPGLIAIFLTVPEVPSPPLVLMYDRRAISASSSVVCALE